VTRDGYCLPSHEFIASEQSRCLPCVPVLADGKSEMSYSDFTKSPKGALFKDAKPGSGPAPEVGDRVVIDWTGASRIHQRRC
jgi:hypothetical protein